MRRLNKISYSGPDYKDYSGNPGEVHDIVTLDGTWIAGTVYLIASDPTNVFTWHWATKEDATSWTVLLDMNPAPWVIIVDGGAGIA